jgi:hypothetical protein
MKKKRSLSVFLVLLFFLALPRVAYGKGGKVEELFKSLKELKFTGFHLQRPFMDREEGENDFIIDINWMDRTDNECKKMASKMKRNKMDLTLINLTINVLENTNQAEVLADRVYHIKTNKNYFTGSFYGKKFGDKCWYFKTKMQTNTNPPISSYYSIIFIKDRILCSIYVDNYARELSPNLVGSIVEKVDDCIHNWLNR